MRSHTPLPALESLLQCPRNESDRNAQISELARRVEELTRAAQAGAAALDHTCPGHGRTARRIRRAAAAIHRPL